MTKKYSLENLFLQKLNVLMDAIQKTENQELIHKAAEFTEAFNLYLGQLEKTLKPFNEIKINGRKPSRNIEEIIRMLRRQGAEDFDVVFVNE